MEWIYAVLDFLYDALFGCRHDRLTRPFTIERQTYKVCLDCGRHMYYSAERMEPLTPRELRRMREIEAGEVKILPTPTHTPHLVPSADRETGAAA
ncbi:MAG TPA: hypothetical protein VM554_07265 [Acidisarcina sp.]|nr:hypothetical protein [Acidisarcina sp.]